MTNSATPEMIDAAEANIDVAEGGREDVGQCLAIHYSVVRADRLACQKSHDGISEVERS